jgi:hypothetical protein
MARPFVGSARDDLMKNAGRADSVLPFSLRLFSTILGTGYPDKTAQKMVLKLTPTGQHSTIELAVELGIELCYPGPASVRGDYNREKTLIGKLTCCEEGDDHDSRSPGRYLRGTAQGGRLARH